MFNNNYIDTKTLKKVFIVTPRFGLCNQLYSITKGIIYSHIYKRDIYFDGFQVDYKNINNLYPIDSIINIDKINEILKEFNIDVCILKEIPKEKIQNIDSNDIPDNKNLCHIDNIIDILNVEKYKNIDYLCIENPISSHIPEEYYIINNKLNTLHTNVFFTDTFIKSSNMIKQKLDLKDYCCIHLRLEDDSIDYMMKFCNLSFDKINEKFIDKYIIEFEKLKLFKYKIYICSSLGIQDNKNNELYIKLKKKYNLLDKNDFIDMNHTLENRELYAIIDFIIAKDSKYFIGCDWSSFSNYIYTSHINNNKYAKNLNLYSDIKG